MKLTIIPNFRVEDYDTEQSWIGKLFIQLNPFIQSVNQIFDTNVDFTTNIKSVTRSYAVTGFQAISFQWPYKDQAPADLRVIQATQGTQQTPTILLAAWSYDAAQLTVSVKSILEVTGAGVSPLSGKYQFQIRASV